MTEQTAHLCDGIGIFVAVEVDVEALLEGGLSQVISNHADDTRSLVVGDGIEDLIHLSGTVHFHLDRMAVFQTYQTKEGRGEFGYRPKQQSSKSYHPVQVL